MRRAANDNKSGADQERHERRPSSNPNSAERAIAASPSPSPTSPASGTGVGLIRGGTGISFNASGPFNIFTQNTRVQGASSRSLFTCSDVVTTPHGIQQVMSKRSHDALGESSCPPSAGGGTTHKRPIEMTFNPFGRMICSYPNPTFPIFDPTRLTVDLPLDPPQPCPPLASTKDGSDDSLQRQKGQPEEVVENNAKEQAAQGVEAAAAAAAEPRSDIYGGGTAHKRPRGMTYNPFGRMICSYPNPKFPIFDPTRLFVDLTMDPPQPYPPLTPNKDASDDNLQPQNGQTGEVVEDNAKEQTAQGGEVAAEPRPAIRDDVVPVVRRYCVPDINLPALEEDEEN